MPQLLTEIGCSLAINEQYDGERGFNSAIGEIMRNIERVT